MVTDLGFRITQIRGIIHPEAQLRRDNEFILIHVNCKPDPDELAVLVGSKTGDNLTVIGVEKRIVRSYAPYQYNVCIEFRVTRNKQCDCSI